MATEMVLIPKATYERLRLSDKKPFIQKDDSISEDASVASSASSASTTSGHTETPSVDRSDSTQVNNYNDNVSQTLLHKFTPDYRLYAKRLLVYIKKHGSDVLSWTDDDYALVSKGKKVEGSDVTELIMHLFGVNIEQPIGLQLFMKGMEAIRVPKAFLKPYMLKPPGTPKSIKNNWIKY